jgi:transposase
MTPYSQELRKQILEACAEPGSTRVEVAARFKVSLSFVVKLLHRQRTTGAVAVKPHAGGMPLKLTDDVQKQLAKLAIANPTLSLQGLQQAFLANGGYKLNPTTIRRALITQLSSNYQAVRKTASGTRLSRQNCPPSEITTTTERCARCAGEQLRKNGGTGGRAKSYCKACDFQGYPKSNTPCPDDHLALESKRKLPQAAGRLDSQSLSKAA